MKNHKYSYSQTAIIEATKKEEKKPNKQTEKQNIKISILYGHLAGLEHNF